MRFKIFMAVTTLLVFFKVNAQCGLVGRSKFFEEACCLHLEKLYHILLLPFCTRVQSDSLPITSALKIDAARFSEKLTSANQFPRNLNPKEHHQNLQTSLT
jgi:hypothetical protein